MIKLKLNLQFKTSIRISSEKCLTRCIQKEKTKVIQTKAGFSHRFSKRSRGREGDKEQSFEAGNP
jgi:hypothetical protein